MPTGALKARCPGRFLPRVPKAKAGTPRSRARPVPAKYTEHVSRSPAGCLGLLGPPADSPNPREDGSQLGRGSGRADAAGRPLCAPQAPPAPAPTRPASRATKDGARPAAFGSSSGASISGEAARHPGGDGDLGGEARPAPPHGEEARGDAVTRCARPSASPRPVTTDGQAGGRGTVTCPAA